MFLMIMESIVLMWYAYRGEGETKCPFRINYLLQRVPESVSQFAVRT